MLSSDAGSDGHFLTHKGKSTIRDSLIVFVLLLSLIAGLWMIEQTMNSVIIMKRDFVDLPFYGFRMDVWSYHDFAYTLLWLSYGGLVAWAITPWKKGELTIGRASAAIGGFILLTAGLWLVQDTMNAVIVLNREYVDFPFFSWKPDLYNARDAARILIIMGFVGFLTIIHITKKETSKP